MYERHGSDIWVRVNLGLWKRMRPAVSLRVGRTMQVTFYRATTQQSTARIEQMNMVVDFGNTVQ